MVHYGYVPAATDPAEIGGDRAVLTAAGCSEIVEESASGRRARVALAALLERLRSGDRITIGAIAHIAHSVSEFHRIARHVEAAGAELCSLAEAFDSRTEPGRATLRILAAFPNLKPSTSPPLQNKVSPQRRLGANSFVGRAYYRLARRQISTENWNRAN